MATISLSSIECVGQRDGNPPLMASAPLLAAQTPNYGDLVYKDGNGKINECGADPASICGVMAMEYDSTYAGTFDGSADLLQSTASTDMHYYRAHPDNLFVGNLGGKAAARTDEGIAYGVAVSGGVWYVDGSDAVNTRVTVHKILSDTVNGVIGDTNARVLFSFNSGNYQE